VTAASAGRMEHAELFVDPVAQVDPCPTGENRGRAVEQLLLPGVDLIGVKLILRGQLGLRNASSATFAFNWASSRRLVFSLICLLLLAIPGADSTLAPGPICGVRFSRDPVRNI
jgi:hypothetical protein